MSHTTGDAVFTWVYRKGALPFNTNITNIGVEGFFYTVGDDSQVDNLITDAEGRFSVLVQHLRGSVPAVVSDPDLPRFIAHLEVRTRHVRESFRQASDFLIARLLDHVSDERAFVAGLERSLMNDPSLFREALSNKLTTSGIPESMLEPLLQLCAPLLPAVMAQIRPTLPQLAEALRAILPQKLKDGAKAGHIRALKKAIAPEIRTRWYDSLSYAIVDSADDLILGDAPVLFHVEGSRPFKPFLDKGDVLKAPVLPLTPQKALVGTCEGSSGLPPGVRQALAQCSLEYFIAAEHSDANNVLKDQIGEQAAFLPLAEMEKLITGCITQNHGGM